MRFETDRPGPAGAEWSGRQGRGRLSVTGWNRFGSEVTRSLEKRLARMERGVRAVAFASAWQALTTVLLQFSKGDHLLVDRETAGMTRRLIRELAPRMGLSVSWINPGDTEHLMDSIRPETRAMWLDMPSGSRLEVADLAKVCRIAAASRIRVIVDSTLLTPCFHRPIEWGADLVVHRGANWLAGRHDVRAVFVVAADEEVAGPLLAMRELFGASPHPVDALRIREGLFMLHARMRQMARTAEKVALWLEQHPAVRKVWYPGLPSHPGHEVMLAQAEGSGGVMVLDVGSDRLARQVLRAVRLSLVPLRPEDRERLEAVSPMLAPVDPGSSGEKGERGLLRLSVGAADADELILKLSESLGSLCTS